MSSLLDRLKDKETWEEFRQYKKDRSQLTRKELNELDTFIAEERFMSFPDCLPMAFRRRNS